MPVENLGPVVLGALLLGGCPGPSAPPPANAMSTPAPEPKLTASATLSSGQLEIKIELNNDQLTAVWVAGALPIIRGASTKMMPAAAYVYPEEDRVVIGRRLFAVPDHIDVMVPIGPEWTRVPAKGRYTGTAVVPWPLLHHRPYLEKTRIEEPLGSPQTLTFELATVPAMGSFESQPPGSGDAVVKLQRIYRTELKL